MIFAANPLARGLLPILGAGGGEGASLPQVARLAVLLVIAAGCIGFSASSKAGHAARPASSGGIHAAGQR